jgi:hypothetical protein
MALSDRDYMKPAFRPGAAKAGFLQRLKFWLWRLFCGR